MPSGAPPPCPALPQPAAAELRARCGPELEGCPALERWLADVLRHCWSVEALR